jgi:antitoxin ParD1/3/4
MDIKLGTYYDNFINEAVVSGKYESKDEVIRKAIMLLSFEEHQKNILREQLVAGENSPMIENFNSKDYLNQIHRKYL